MIRIALALVVGFFSSSAWAIDFTAPILGLDHKPMVECKQAAPDGKTCEKSGPILLGEVCAAALDAPDQRQQGQASAALDDVIRRAKLAEKVLDAKNLSLTSEEATMVKNQVAKMGLSPIIVYAVVKAVDPAAAK